MKGFRIKIPDRVFNKLKKFPKDRQKQILNKIELIAKIPEYLDIRKMGGREDTYRLRVGDYRVVFVVDSISKEINVDKIGSRSEIEKYY
jgi:mRNA interferase RelE/StbE